MKHTAVPEWRDAAVAQEPACRSAHSEFAGAVRLLVEQDPSGSARFAVLAADAAAHALDSHDWAPRGVHGRAGSRQAAVRCQRRQKPSEIRQ